MSSKLAARSPRATARRLMAVLIGALLLLGQTQGTAFGEHGGRDIGSFANCNRPVIPPRCTSVGNDFRHHVAFDASLTPALADALRRSMAEDYDAPTRLTLIEESRVTARTDVVAFSGDYGDNGAAGWVFCPTEARQGTNPSGHRWCQQQELHLNFNPRYGLFFDDADSRDHIACHELGHTVGLRHWGNPPQTDGPAGATCMNGNTPNGPTSLHPNDIDHINRYGYRVRPPSPAFRLVHAPDPVTDPAPVFAGMPAGTLDALETEAIPSLPELIEAADAIVHGRIVDVDEGRVFGPSTHPFHYAAATVEVIERIHGTLPAAHERTLTLEIALFDGPAALDRLRAEMVGSERILFLRNKGESARAAGLSARARAADAPFYRLVTFAAEVVDLDGTALVPDDEHAPLARVAGQPFARAIAMIRAALP